MRVLRPSAGPGTRRGSRALQLLEEDHLLDVVARQAVRLGHQRAVALAAPRGVAQASSPGRFRIGPAVAVIAEDGLGREGPALGLDVGRADRRSCCSIVCAWAWLAGRDPGVDRRTHAHAAPPAVPGRRQAAPLAGLALERPPQEVLVRLVPPALPVRMGLGRTARAPLAFHAALHDAPTHQEGSVRQPGFAPPDNFDPRPRELQPTGPAQAELVICDQAIDITYVATQEGWLYLAVLLDAHSRRVVGWALADHLRTALALDALAMALRARRPRPG